MTADTRWVRPAPGRRVRFPGPGGKPLTDAGVLVAWTSYWQRRLDAGDVEIFEPAAAAPAPPPAPPPAKAPPPPAPDTSKDA